MFRRVLLVGIGLLVMIGNCNVSGTTLRDKITSASINLSGQGTLSLTVASDNIIDFLFKRGKLELKIFLDPSEWMVNQDFQYDFLKAIAQELNEGIGLVALEESVSRLSSVFATKYKSEIVTLKKYLRLPESNQNTLEELRKRKANRDISSSQLWVEDLGKIPSKDVETGKKINEALRMYERYISGTPLKELAFLYTAMRMLHDYDDMLENDVRECILTSLKTLGVTVAEQPKEVSEDIFDWMQENAEEFLGEYHM